jgi:hypothetical protein
MITIVYPSYPFKIKEEDGKETIFDEVRKQWVRLTPEEWVRQNFLRYLLEEKKYPASLIAVEKEIKLNDLRKRCDIIVYDRKSQPWLMVECKSMEETLDEKVAMQVVRYNMALPVSYVVITNGQYTLAYEKKEGIFSPLNELPIYTG